MDQAVRLHHGRTAADRHRHDQRGRNSRLDTLQAAMLAVKLAGLDDANRARRRAMDRYRRQLPPSIRPVTIGAGVESVHHLAVVRVADRAAVTAALGLPRNRLGRSLPLAAASPAGLRRVLRIAARHRAGCE